MEQITQRNWIAVDNAVIAIDAIDAFVAGEDGGTVVFLRGGGNITVWQTVAEFADLIQSTNP